MTREPKLLTDLRAAKARGVKGAKAAAPAAPLTPMTGTVETPASALPPSNYIAEALAECTTVEQCEELLAHAQQHGYDPNGQTVPLIRKRMAAIKVGDVPKRRATKSPDKGARRR